MARVTITLQDDKVDAYRRIAKYELKSLSTVIAEHLNTSELRPTTSQFYQAANDVHRKLNGFLSRDQANQITSIVLHSLHEASKPC